MPFTLLYFITVTLSTNAIATENGTNEDWDLVAFNRGNVNGKRYDNTIVIRDIQYDNGSSKVLMRFDPRILWDVIPNHMLHAFSIKPSENQFVLEHKDRHIINEITAYIKQVATCCVCIV